MIYEIEGIPAISRVNPHVPTPCIIPPRPCPPCTRSHHRLNNFPNTVSIYMRAQTSSLPFPLLSLRSNILCSPMRCNGCANFFRDLFFITIPAVSLHFPFRWTVARISISRHSNSTLFFSSRLLPIFYFSLSFYFFHKKINRGRRRISRKLLPSFLSPPRFFLFFPIPFRRATTIVNFKLWWIYIYTKSIEFDFDRTYTLKCIESRDMNFSFAFSVLIWRGDDRSGFIVAYSKIPRNRGVEIGYGKWRDGIRDGVLCSPHSCRPSENQIFASLATISMHLPLLR